MKRFGVLLLVVWLGMSVLNSCADDRVEPGDGETGQDEVLVHLVVSRPYAGKNADNGRGMDPETEIDEIQVLVFEEGAYKYRVPGISIMNTGTTTSFRARLLASGKRLDLYIVANATSAVLANEPKTDDTEEQVRTDLQMAFPVGGSFPVLPMFGRCHLPLGLSANQVKDISGIKMLRAISRIDVLAGSVPEFELTSIQAFRANDRIQLIPAEDVQTVTRPSVPEGSSRSVNTTAVAVTGNQALAEVYLPESATVAEADRVTGASCIVVGGRYGSGGDVSYYRIDFDPDNVNGSFGQILRNHRYVFTIRSVAGPGWPSAGEAANNRSAQINLEVKAWDESTTDMYFDTEHYFGVSGREAVLTSKQNASATVSVNTDLPDYTFQWSDESGNVSGTVSDVLTDSFFKVQKAGDGKTFVVTALQDNKNSQTERMGYFVITAGRWRIRMTIRQSFTDVSGRPISLLSFRNSLGYLGVNLLLPKVAAEGRGTGGRGILDNLNNFGPSGTVSCGGFNLLLSNASPKALSDAVLAVADIIYFNYVSSSSFSEEDIPPIRRWLEGSTKRVLIVSYDGNSINIPVLKEFLGSGMDITWFSSNTGPYPLVGKSATNFFTDTGPFTVSPYTPIADGFTFQNYDIYHGEIGAGSAGGITRLLNGPGGGIVLGIDVSRRIIYMGDIDLFTSSSGTGATSANHIDNTAGTISNDAAKLIANVFAWAVGIVTGG